VQTSIVSEQLAEIQFISMVLIPVLNIWLRLMIAAQIIAVQGKIAARSRFRESELMRNRDECFPHEIIIITASLIAPVLLLKPGSNQLLLTGSIINKGSEIINISCARYCPCNHLGRHLVNYCGGSIRKGSHPCLVLWSWPRAYFAVRRIQGRHA
jgi:hypothetical protein